MAKKATTAKAGEVKSRGTDASATKSSGTKATGTKATGTKSVRAETAGKAASSTTATAAAASKSAKAIVAELDAPKSAKPDVAKDRSAKATTGKAPVLLTLTDIGDHLASTFDMPKSHAKIYLAEAVALIGKTLKKGNKVRISGLGVFQVKKRAARKGRNPTTGESIKIKASKRVGFAVARDLKAKL